MAHPSDRSPGADPLSAGPAVVARLGTLFASDWPTVVDLAGLHSCLLPPREVGQRVAVALLAVGASFVAGTAHKPFGDSLYGDDIAYYDFTVRWDANFYLLTFFYGR